MSTNTRPKVSVALCTYNGAEFLSAQLDSIINQSYPADEIIIIDDCSTDNTVEIIKKYADNYDNIKYSINEKNLGFLQNFSHAVEKTGGDFVALADQDDIWFENHLEILLNCIRDCAACVGDCIMIDAKGNATGKKFSEMKQNFYIPDNDASKAYRIVYNQNPYQGASMLIDRKWVESFLPIPPEVDFHDTYFALCACLTKGFAVIPDIVNQYRIHTGQASNPGRASIWNDLRRKHHFICYPNKIAIIERILNTAPYIPAEASIFINEFKLVMELDHHNKRLEVLKIKNQHYKEIYSCPTYKYILLRSLHYLLAK